VSTSNAQVIARALYDSLIRNALETLRTAAAKLDTVSNNGSQLTKQQIIAALPPDAPRQLQNLLLTLAQAGTLDELPHVADAFERYVQATSHDVLTGEVTSAVALNDAQRTRIIEDLQAKYGRTLELRFHVDPSIIGGLIIRVGDQVLDNSLRARLSVIQRNMLAS
jgi:F-type H+-transporting ATPase subunit delta